MVLTSEKVAISGGTALLHSFGGEGFVCCLKLRAKKKREAEASRALYSYIRARSYFSVYSN